MNARGALRAALVTGLILTLAACGFHLRGRAQLPPEMARTYISGASPNDPLVRALNDALRANGVDVVGNANEATAVLHIDSLHTAQSILTLSVTGQVTAYRLVTTLAFSVRAVKGSWHIPTQQLQVQRQYSYNPSQVLGKSDEAMQLREDMGRELANLMLLRLQAHAGS